jgi:nitrate reductase (cytochrome), electron transfer subunit
MNRSRYILIGLAVLLMAALVVVVGQSLTAGQREARVPAAAGPTTFVPSEPIPSSVAVGVVDYAAMPREPNKKRTLAVYYSRRTAPGEPPFIPHPVPWTDESGRTCLACHIDGGWAPPFTAYTPVTPHPDMVPCQSCHEPQKTPAKSPSFPLPRLQGASKPGIAPSIPHSLEMRENCIACHVGPGAVDELRTNHPERGACQKCHKLAASSAEASASPSDKGTK